MKLTLTIIDKTIDLDEHLNMKDMEITLFQCVMYELMQYVNGYVTLSFESGDEISIDLFSDFIICYEDIVGSVRAAKENRLSSGEIWFCEQGSDFYLSYEIKKDCFIIEFKKGSEAGLPNGIKEDFRLTLKTDNYDREKLLTNFSGEADFEG